MNILFNSIFLVIISKIKCQQLLNEKLDISTQKPGEIDLKKTQIDRRFLEDLDDEEWLVAHLRGAVLDGRRDCMSETFADKARRYRKMLREDGARVEFVSSKALTVNPEDIVVDTCKVDVNDQFVNVNMKVTSANFEPTVAQNGTSANTTETTKVTNTTKVSNTTETTKVGETTPKMDFKATTVESKVESKKKKSGDKPGQNTTDTRRGSEYMFSSVEYYDESIEFDETTCPDAVEIITLQIDQLRSYDLECEMIVEWRSLE